MHTFVLPVHMIPARTAFTPPSDVNSVDNSEAVYSFFHVHRPLKKSILKEILAKTEHNL